MDCYSVESEFIESLDFLSPPVKRVHNSREAFGSAYNTETNDVHLLRGLRNKFARRAPSSTRNLRTVKATTESSTSLILKKTSQRQILEQYSIVSYTSLHNPENDTPRNINTAEKPLIKVTVIPKSDQIQTAKILRKRRYIPERVQSTTSNHENSIQTKNVYLIVAGRRREKIYEIKTTGSAKLSIDNDSYMKDEVPIKELSNFKHLIQSLNMDKKKKKNKKAPVNNLDVPQQTSFQYPECEDCMCVDESKEDTPKKGRVRIFGQFGISEDDKYVLRYGATVNDKQVLSDVAQLTQDFSPVVGPMASYSTTCDERPERQRDSCVQADYENEVEQLPVRDEVPRKESQGTQVNFKVQVATMHMKNSKFSDKKIQCSCCTVPHISDQKPLKDCESPLVIISVYPKQTPPDITKPVPSVGENMRFPSPPKMNTFTSSQVLKKDKGTRKSNIETRRSIKSPQRSRSPSPIKKASRTKLKEDKPVKAQISEKRNPDRQKALRAIKEKIQEKDKLKYDVGTTRKPSKFSNTNATQVSKNFQDLTISNATKASTKNQQVLSAANVFTQVSAKNRPINNFTTSNATQYSKTPESTPTSMTTQRADSPQSIAPIKHSKIVSSIKYPQNMNTSIKPHTALVSNATQVYTAPPLFTTQVGTQVSNNENINNLFISNGTQVSKIRQNVFASQVSKNQETYTSNAAQVIKTDRAVKPNLKYNSERGTNTDHARAKKALVENYTKKLTKQMNQKDIVPPRFDNSKVTINIDGDKEYYDVLFNQDKLSTDLTIRKTLKDMGSQKCHNVDECPGSLENVLYLPDCAVDKRGLLLECKSPTSLMLYNIRSDDESVLGKRVSRLTIRDSLEISHRREDKSNHNNIKNTQTCFTAQFAGKNPDETEFLAPIKHYTGDDCSICNPIARDKQIRELLGVDKPKHTNANTKQFQKLCPRFKSTHRDKEKCIPNASVSVQCRHGESPTVKLHQNPRNYSPTKGEEIYNSNNGNRTRVIDAKYCVSLLKFSDNSKVFPDEDLYNDTYPSYNNYDDKVNPSNYNGGDEQDDNRYEEEKSALYQQLVLNRNIQVFLQVDQFSKQKPIILSRKQYDKVKKTIQKTICKKKSSHDKRHKYVCDKCDSTEVSVGEVRTKKAKDANLLHENEAQTDLVACSRESCRRRRRERKHKSRKIKSKHDSSDLSEDQAEYHRSRSRKKGRSSEHKSKRKGDRNLDVITIHHSGKVPWRGDEKRPNRARNEEPKTEREAGRVVTHHHKKRKVECDTELYTDNEERDQELFTERKNLSPEQSREQKEDYSPERYPIESDSPDQYLEEKASHACCSPERCSKQRQSLIDEKYSGRSVSRTPEIFFEQDESHSPERYYEETGSRSPERYFEQNGSRSPGRYFEQDETHSPERYCEQDESRNPESYCDEDRSCICVQNKSQELRRYKNNHDDSNDEDVIQRNETEVKTLVLFNAENTKGNLKDVKETDNEARTKKTMSSMEVRYASIAYMKQVAYSSTDVGVLSDSSIAHVNSFHTIFRGHRKSPTPNLGTSAYSLYSEDILNSEMKSAKFVMEPRDSKPKKPFLRRLMSCLVMRSTRDSELKLPTGPAPDLPSVNSSIDSYHISTSLGAVEVSSSIYDTSASFYSNHTIFPVNNKIKRGFFSSVRGFLTNRKS